MEGLRLLNTETAKWSVWDFSGVYDYLSYPPQSGPAVHLDMSGISGTNCYCDDEAAAKICERIAASPECKIHFIDSGNYHYMTNLFLRGMTRRFILVVFDNHTDMQPPAFGGLLSCGGWLADAVMRFENLWEVWLIGPDEEAFFAVPEEFKDKVRFLSREKLASFREKGRLDAEAGKWLYEREIPEGNDAPSDMYISLDKDILSDKYISTTWSMGDMSPDELVLMLKSCLAMAREKGLQVSGIDICGEAEPHDIEGCTKSSMVNRAVLESCFGPKYERDSTAEYL